MKAKDQKEIKGIYYNEKNGNVYFVNKVYIDTVSVSRIEDLREAAKILKDKKTIETKLF